MTGTRHTVLGAFHGVFYDLPSGRRLYLAHKKRSELIKGRNAWMIETSVLDKCRAAGVEAVGVLVKHENRRLVWLTHIDDFYGPASTFKFDVTKKRVLPAKLFRIDPAKSEAVIARIIKLR
jgi:hypothetical protein